MMQHRQRSTVWCATICCLIRDMRLLLRPLILLLPLLIPAIVHADEWWGWTMLEVVHQPPWTAGALLGFRFDDADAFTSEFISPRVHYEAMSWLDVGFNLTFLNIADIRTSEHYTQIRPEFEMTPKLQLTPDLRVDLRNRFEARRNQQDALTTNRYRNRLQVAWTLPKPIGPLVRVFANNEWLIDLHRQSWTENRLIPLGLTFNAAANADFDLFYMIDSTRPKTDWRHESVLGTYLRLRF